MNNSKNKILVISGPTGSGESTISNEIVSRLNSFSRLVTATSRSIRKGEKDKVDYYFFSKEEFLEKIASGDILEYTYIENRDTYYGTYKPDLDEKLEKGYVIVNVDHVGVDFFKKNYDALAIFIKPKSIEELVERLKKRNPEMSTEELAFRLENARNEIKNEEHYYDFVVINKDGCLEDAIKEIIIILKQNGFELQ